MMMPGEKFKSAQEFWETPPVNPSERVSSRRNVVNRKSEHPDYMDFAELYADYVIEYEKANTNPQTSASVAAHE